jgi:hypothetical protein
MLFVIQFRGFWSAEEKLLFCVSAAWQSELSKTDVTSEMCRLKIVNTIVEEDGFTGSWCQIAKV